MNTLIDPLKGIARDLVEKKLWPIAVLLLAAIIGVPMVIGGSSSEEAAAPAAVVAKAPAAAGAQSLVSVVDPAVTGKDTRPGRLDDPFYDPPEPQAAATSSPAGTTAGTTAGAAPSSAPAGAGPTPAAGEKPVQTTTTAPQPPTKPVAESSYHRTEVRWYEATAGKRRPLARLTPLGGRVAPAALYLGVTKSRTSYAVFLLDPNATSDGDAKCEDIACRVIGLKAGQTQIVTLHPPDGSAPRRYHLDVVAVRTIATDAVTARKMRLRVHADGREVMRAMWQHAPTAAALGPIQFDRDSGLLVKSATAAAASAAAPAAAQQAAG